MMDMYDLAPGSRLYEFSVSCGTTHEAFVEEFRKALDVVDTISATPWPAEQVLLLMLFLREKEKRT